MIISASRRTDIPAFHAEWMMERLREGYALVRNPFNARQVSRVSLTRVDAEAIVFWTKDASNMLRCLDELDGMGFKYMFQYTLTPYGQDIERNVDKRGSVEALMKLSARSGKNRVIWRYDPILLGGGWDCERHMRAFEALCRQLEGAVGRCVISFVDLYASVKRNAKWIQPNEEQMRAMARQIAQTARAHGMIPSACAEAIDLTEEGIEPRGCVDRADIADLLGLPIRTEKDTGQRTACRCIRSVDIGAYDTCAHGCVYCYARTGRGPAEEGGAHSPILGGCLREDDRVTERKERPVAAGQVSFLDSPTV